MSNLFDLFMWSASFILIALAACVWMRPNSTWRQRREWVCVAAGSVILCIIMAVGK